ncbi:hypothetical protein BDZ91DRAFT_803569 [Kalaharituber pfeilii]|nr:hypothetical protein BDZ91DRAFT_803569 [Kalaharituber pfeilii]
MDLFFSHQYDESTSNGFTRFVLSNKPFSTQDFGKLHVELAKDPDATGLLLTSETNRALFLSDFSERIQRIITWLECILEANIISKVPFNKDIIHNFTSHLVIPLLDSSYSEFFLTRGFPELIISTIQLSYIYRSHSTTGPKSYKILLERVSKIPDLIQRILPSIDGAKVIQTILAEAQSGAEIRSFGTVQTLAEWMKVAVKLCQECRANHYVKDELYRWSSLLELQNTLKRVLKVEITRRSQVTQLPQLTTSQYKTTPASPSGVPLSAADLRTLKLFNICPPAGIGAVEATIEQLQEKETFRLFQAFVKSFPCAACFHINTVTSAFLTRANPLSFSAPPDSFTGTLLGQKMGPWRVCLSEKAFQDTLASIKDGHFTMITRKLRELASGNWDLKSLRQQQMILGQADEKEHVPLWGAVYGSNGRILWQVNVGFDEDYDTDSQIITIWRIGDSSEIQGSIRDVLQLHKAYSTSDIQRRFVSLLQFPVLPKKYFGPAKQESDEPGLDKTVLEAQETLMSNKMYCVTEKVLNRIFMGREPDYMAFPFELSHKQMEIIKHSNTATFIIFLTRSTYLAHKLQDYLERLVVSQLGTFPDSAKTLGELKEAQNNPLELLTLENIDDNKFPIVCTFHDLFNFLEKIISLNDREDLMGCRPGEVSFMGKGARVIDYNIYRHQYWQKHIDDCKERFEPDLVFSEILGIIKGSTSAKRNFQPLSREEYLELSARKAIFTDSKNTIYDIYQNYEAKKRSLGDIDDIDRVTYLLRSLEKDQSSKRTVQSLFDEIYIDEIQDKKLLEIDLLLTLIRNPHGIHFAADAAKCIFRDNTFRIPDVKVRFYEHFIAMANEARQASWAKPELFTLSKNYKTHQGILSLAADIAHLLSNVFPSQIDILPPEVGVHPGTKPSMFVGFDYNILKQAGAGMFGTEVVWAHSGAEQVIIVRNDATRQNLMKELNSALILTVFQCKDLVFDDVILYNFFSDSTWKKNRQELCMELKHLYEAVTRARKNLWILESDPESVQHILKVWTRVEKLKEPLISIVHNGPEGEHEAINILNPGKAMESRAWKEYGERLLHQGLYEDALLSFRRAQHQQGQALARAYLLYKEARGLDVDQSNKLSPQAIELFLNAAKLFMEASFTQKAAETYAAVRDYIKATETYAAAGDYIKAAETYAAAGDYIKAAETYAGAGDYIKAAENYVAAGDYIKAAKTYVAAGDYIKAAETYAAAGDYIKAADILRAREEYGKAGILFERADEFMKAATCYHMAKEYDNTVKAYRRGEHFAELIAYLNQHRDCISIDVQKRCYTLINILIQRGIDTLGDRHEREEFYKKIDRTEELLAGREEAIEMGNKLDCRPQEEAEVIIAAIIAHGQAPRYSQQRAILETSGLDLIKGIIELGQLLEATHELAMAVLTRSGRAYKVSSVFVEEVQDLIGRLDKRRRHVEKTKAHFTQSEARNLLEMAPEKLKEKLSTGSQTLGRFLREVKTWKTKILDGIAEGEKV